MQKSPVTTGEDKGAPVSSPVPMESEERENVEEDLSDAGILIPEVREDSVILSDDDGNMSDTPEVVEAEIGFQLPVALQQIQTFFRPPQYPISREGHWFPLTFDLDSDGWPEIFIPGIESEYPEYAEFEYISNLSRLYDLKKDELKFYLYIFSHRETGYHFYHKVDCGYNQVFKSFTHFFGNTQEQNPFILSLTFQTGEGMLQKWIIFTKPALRPISTLQIKETLLKKTIIEDIDGDGHLDVVLLESNAEEKIGYETYLTWLKWNGHSFAEYKNTNIVRNLNYFLREVKELCLAGELANLLAYAIDNVALRKARSSGLSDTDILSGFLGIMSVTGDDAGLNLLDGITGFVFPEILDNPFFKKDEYGYYFSLSYRINYEDDIFIISQANLYMLANPFGARQFSFLSRED